MSDHVEADQPARYFVCLSEKDIDRTLCNFCLDADNPIADNRRQLTVADKNGDMRPDGLLHIQLLR